MARPVKTIFKPDNPEKYTGNYPIVARSSWELELMKVCDNHPDVIAWASEPVKIPYKNPTRERSQSIYIPDFLITTLKNGEQKTTLYEVKPMHEALNEHTRNDKDAVTKMKNDAKWSAAAAWCMRRGIDFKVLTEAQMFHGYDNVKAVRPNVPAQVKKLTPKAPSRAAGRMKKALTKKIPRLSKATVTAKVRKSPKSRKSKKAKKS